MKYKLLCQPYPILVVAIYHCRVQDLVKQLSKEIPQPNCLIASHASSKIIFLCIHKTTDFYFLLIQDIMEDPKARATTRCALPINNFSSPIKISVFMQYHIFGSISQTKIDHPMQISQYMFGNNPMCMKGINHKLTQTIHCKAYIQMVVRKEHQFPNQLLILRRIHQIIPSSIST